MKFASKLSLTIFFTGIIILFVILYITYIFSRSSILASSSTHTESLTDTLANDIEKLLIEKTKTSLMIANTPLLKKTLSQSNIFYSGITDSKRPNVLKTLDMKWKNSRTATNYFIRQYTDNPIYNYLKEQQIILNGEYGEIFLTNRFGALMAFARNA